MQIIGPETFPTDLATPVPDPAQRSGGNPSAACQIQNSSSYQLNIDAGAGTLSLQPFTAQTVEISAQPITVDPISTTGSGACTLTLVFLLPTPPGIGVQLEGPQGAGGQWVEAPPMTDGPLTAAAIAAAISGFVETGDAIDLLSSGTYTLASTGAGSLPIASISVTDLQRTYAAVLFAFVPNASPDGRLFCAEAQDVSPPLAPTFSAAFNAQPQWEPTQSILAFGNQVGDNMNFVVYGFVDGGVGTYQLFGLTSCPVPIRTDGRAYAIGAVGDVDTSTAAATTTFLPAIGNVRYLIKTVASLITQSGTGCWAAVTGQINGNPGLLIGGAMANGVETVDAPEGILLDTDSPVMLTIAGGTVTGHTTTVIYDVVPA